MSFFSCHGSICGDKPFLKRAILIAMDPFAAICHGSIAFRQTLRMVSAREPAVVDCRRSKCAHQFSRAHREAQNVPACASMKARHYVFGICARTGLNPRICPCASMSEYVWNNKVSRRTKYKQRRAVPSTPPGSPRQDIPHPSLSISLMEGVRFEVAWPMLLRDYRAGACMLGLQDSKNLSRNLTQKRSTERTGLA